MPGLEKNNAVKLAGVVGWPVEHSLSPLIHTIWAHRARVNGFYIPVATPPDYDAFVRMMSSLQAVGFQGVNVTLPHKENALRYAVDASPAAKKAGAANMVTFGPDGPYADNSDISGFANALHSHLKPGQTIDNAMVLGAGGAARGVVLALHSIGITGITITNRTREKAETIASDFNLKLVDWTGRDDAVGDANLIINTTSLGMSGQPPLILDASRLSSKKIVADIVYTPVETELLRNAKVQGCQTFGGLDMLMHQAVPGFQSWFGGKAVIDDELYTELISELDRRSQK